VSNQKFYKVSLCVYLCMENTKTYRLEVPEAIWIKFRETLMKNDVINKVIIDMIKKRIEDFQAK